MVIILNLYDVTLLFKDKYIVKNYPFLVTLEVSGTMSVDAFITKTSIKSESKIHSSTYFGGSIDILGTKLLQVQIKVPKERIEIFDASVDFLWYKEGDYQPLASYQKQESLQLCSPNTVNTLTGLEACGHVSYFHGRNKGDPHWFFTGPSRLSFVFQKTDTFKSLIAKYAWITDSSHQSRGPINDISLVYDTPGSQSNRKTVFKISNDEKKTFFDLDLIIPVLGFKFGLKYDWTERRKVFTFGASFGNREVVRVTTQLIRYSNKYEGVARLTLNEEEILNWEGKLHVKQRKFSLDASIKSKFHDELRASGEMIKLKGLGKLKIEGSLKSSFLFSNVSMDTRIQENVFSITGGILYKLHNQKIKTINISSKLLKLENDGRVTKKLQLNLNVSIKNDL